MAEPITCANPKCGRGYNPSFTKCPFCNTPSISKAPSAGPDYTAIAEQTIASHRAFVPLEFHPAAVAVIDAFFDATWGPEGLAAGDASWEPNEGQRVAIVNFGAFFGDLLRRELGGRWQADPAEPDNPFKAHVVLRVGAQEVDVAPVRAAYHRMRNGATATFESSYAQLRTLFRRSGTPEEIDGWVRYARHFAGIGRPDLAEQFLGRALALGPSPARRAELAGLLAQAAATAKPSTEDAPVPVTAAAPAQASQPVATPPAPPAPTPELDPGQQAVLDRLARAKASIATGDHAQALGAFERVLEIDPSNAAALIGKGGSLAALGRREEALVWLDGFSGRYDCEPGRSFVAACVADELDDVVRAHALFAGLKDSARLSPERRGLAAERSAALANHPEVLLAAVDQVPELSKAIEAYARISDIHPTLAKPWCEQGVGLAMLGRADEALACFDRAAQLEPAEPASYDHKAVTLARLQRFDEAIGTLDAGLRGCPTSGRLLTRRGIFLTQVGRHAEARHAFDASLRVDPSYTKALAYKGDLEQRMGHSTDAIASLDRFLATRPKGEAKLVEAVRRQLWVLKSPGRQRDPELGMRSQSQGLASAARGDFAEALPSFDEAVAADPLCADHWTNRASCLHNLGRMDEALASYRAAEELLDLRSTLVRDGIVSCLLHLDRAPEALACHDRYEDRRGKARTLVRIGRPAEALPIYRQLVAKTPADHALLVARADALTAANRPFEASVAYAAAGLVRDQAEAGKGIREGDGC